MKIELWYDAVAQETDILINETPVEKNDIYGFLYSVRNYPIQSWLYSNGSWKGIEYQINDLARNENVELIFHGRKCDYDDLHKCLSESKLIELKFIEWNICSRYDELFSDLLSTLKNNDLFIREMLSALQISPDYNIQFDMSVSELNWAYHIYNDSDFDKSGDVHSSCCYIHNSYFTSYEKLQDLLSLTRRLKIPADSIYCCFNDNQTKDDYRYYASSFKGMNFTFCLENTEYIEESKIKYGLPAVVRFKILKCSELLKTLCSVYSEIKSSMQGDFHKLAKNVVSLNQEENERYQKIKQLRNNVGRLIYGMDLVYKYIDILLSVSKDNKDEVFHYECIDKLNENIRLHLNIKTFSEVN